MDKKVLRSRCVFAAGMLAIMIAATTSNAQVTDINPGSASSDAAGFTEWNEELYFQANDGVHGVELWKADQQGNVTMVADIAPGSVNSSSQPFGFISLGDDLLFTANDGTHGYELWAIRGQSGATKLIADIWGGSISSLPHSFALLGDFVYFFANDGSSGEELWRTDGTLSGTVLVDDINPGPASGGPGFRWIGNRMIQPFGGALYFPADNGVTGVELYRSSGGPAELVANFAPEDPDGSINSSHPTDFAICNGQLYIGASGDLYVPSGPGVQLVEANSGHTALHAHGDELYFGLNSRIKVYDTITDTTTTLATVVRIEDHTSGTLPHWVEVSGELRFQAYRSDVGHEMFATDGNSVWLHEDINPGPQRSQPAYMTWYQGELIYTAYEPDTGFEPRGLESLVPTHLPELTPYAVGHLGASFPNPANPEAVVPFTLSEAGPVTLTVLDSRGSLVRTLASRRYPAGVHEVKWDGTDATGHAVASGVYHVQLQAGHGVDAGKLVLVK